MRVGTTVACHNRDVPATARWAEETGLSAAEVMPAPRD